MRCVKVSIEKKDVEYVAGLARLALSADEVELYTTQMQRILGYVEKLSELDTTGVEPTSYTVPLTSVMRDDVPAPSLERDRALDNAPASERGCFKVPKIIE